MYQINRKLIFVFASILAASVSSAEEVVYLKSSEPCLVEAYPAPEVASPLSEKLSCGEKATVLEHRGPIVRIQLGEDKVVWVVRKDTTTDVPAEVELQRMRDDQNRIEQEMDILNKKVKALSESSEKLINALVAAEAAKNR